MFAPEGDGCLQRAKREDAGRFSKEGKSLDDFCRAFGHSKARERKSFFMLKITPHPPLSRSPFSRWRRLSIRFFFCKIRRKRKSYQKENAEISFRALRSATDATVGSCRLPKNAGENFNGLAKTLLQREKLLKAKKQRIQ